MTAIFKREVKSYFITPMGYVFLAFNLLLSGVFFFLCNFASTPNADLSSYFGNLGVILLFFVPILTMKSIAEERANKTDQLLFTSPVSPLKIVLAKYFAVCTVFLIGQVISLIYLIILMIHGTPNIINSLSMYVGFCFMGFSLLSVGVFASSLTANQIVSAVISFAFVMLLYLADSITSIIGEGAMYNLISWVSVLKRYESFTGGILSLPAIVYFITFSALFLSFTVFRLSRINLKQTTNFLIAIAIVLGLNVGVDALVNGAGWNLEYNLTENYVYPLNAKSKKIIKNLKKEYSIYYFATSSFEGQYYDGVLKRIDRLTDKISYKKEKELGKKEYTSKLSGGKKITDGSVYIVSGDDVKKVNFGDLEIAVSSQIDSILVNTLENIDKGISSRLAFIVNDDETALDNSALQSLGLYAGLDIVEIDIRKEKIPANVDVAIIESSDNDFSTKSIKKLEKYAKNGGNFQVYYDYLADQPRLLSFIKKRYGVTFDDGVIVENSQSKYIYYQDQETYEDILAVISDIKEHAITSAIIKDKQEIYVPNSRPVRADKNARVLLQTSDTGMVMVDGAEDEKASKNIAVYADSGKSSIVAVGSSGFAEGFASYNFDFIVNASVYQAGVKTIDSVRPIPLDEGILVITGSQMIWYGVVLVAIMPLILIVLAVVVYRKRRKM